MKLALFGQNSEDGNWTAFSNMMQYKAYDSVHLDTTCKIAKDVRELVSTILMIHREATTIGNVYIIDHGSANHISVGDDMITGSFSGEKSKITTPWITEFSKLKGVVKGYIHFQNCYAGLNEGPLQKIADVTNCVVWGGTGYDWTVFQANSGQYKGFKPNGKPVITNERPKQ